VGLLTFLEQFKPSGKLLGLIHCTPVIRGIKAVEARVLNADLCPVYDSRLVYLFYGRPAFKPLQDVEASRLAEHLPMCLVLDAALMARSERMVPFDSGGFARYSASTGLLPRQAFEMKGDQTLPPRIVSAFYESNLNYFRQMPTVRCEDIPLSYPEARAIARMAADPSVFDDDDRRSTIEVQFSFDLSLRESLIAVIGPTVLDSEVCINELLADCPRAALLTYRTYGRQKPIAHSGQIYDLVEDFYRWKALL
jgi:hypothetical protein